MVSGQLTQIGLILKLTIKNTHYDQNHEGKLSMADYKLLLLDMRQQVIDGSQWISRAASNIDIDLFELRSAFIKHTATEHKDYQMLEKNYVALGGQIETIQSGEKNIGSVALNLFHVSAGQ